jgi:ribonuclease BN (tRNA processing enzyme)
MTRNTRPRNCGNGADGDTAGFNQAMQIAEMAGVEQLALTHHDPDHDDEFLEPIEKLCRERFPNAVLAREGMVISIQEES